LADGAEEKLRVDVVPAKMQTEQLLKTIIES